jgi:recombination protein RecT
VSEQPKDETMNTQAKQLSPVAAFRKNLEGGQRDQIAKQLPKGVDVDRFVRTAMTVVQMNPELLLCTPTSLFGSIMLAAKDGLLPDGKEAVIQPYNVNVAKKGAPAVWEKQAQYIPMVKGLMQIMYRSGEVAMVDGVAVYEKDVFEYERGDMPRIIHKPYTGIEAPGPVVAAYVVIKLKNGEIKREVMFRRDIEAVRNASKAKDGPGWKNWYDQFAIKAVIKRAFKQLPTDSEDFERVIQHDNDAMGFDFSDKPQALQGAQQPRIAAQPGQPSRLQSIIGARSQPMPMPVDDHEPVYFGDEPDFNNQSDHYQ